jgi:hypothetical protein
MKSFGLAVLLVLALAVSASAGTVYLKDGEEIDARSAWKKGNTVFVLVNRDILLTFPADEVNVSRSGLVKGGKKSKSKKHCPRRKTSSGSHRTVKRQASLPSQPDPQ